MPPAILSKPKIRAAAPSDAEQLCAIYNPYVLSSTITFEETAVTPADMAKRVREVQSASLPWLVATDAEEIMGYAYASPWKSRAAYKFSVETAIYLRQGLHHAGIGSQLYGRLLEALKSCGMHAVIGGVALPNDASLRLHQKLGFEQIAHFKQVGFKQDRWIDVTYWQIIL